MIRALIIDGQNNHDWPRTTAGIRAALEGHFDIEVATVTEPARFTADFSRYAAVISNYFGPDWPEATMAGLEDYVRQGGGYVVVHAGATSFKNRASYNRLTGLAWRDANHGDRLTLDAAGNVVRTPRGVGPGAGHGPCFAFPINHHAPEHPIVQGLPAVWMHAKDELWHGLRGPAEELTILASAFSPRTGAREPMMWTVGFGSGRVFVTVLGHIWKDGETTAVECVGFRHTLARGCQWAATGQVDLPVPANFPKEGEISI
jgi:type 1 glutamine amidotransferase